MHILILGSDLDGEAAHLKGSLESAGASVDYWDNQLFPQYLQLTWQAHTHEGWLYLPGGKTIVLNEIQSVFWHHLYPIDGTPYTDSHPVAMADSSSLLRSLIRGCSAHWVNSWEAHRFYQEKPLQLSAVENLGIAIPKTLTSNSLTHLKAFAAMVSPLILKSFYRNTHATLLEVSQLDQDFLRSAIQRSPITLQEYIPGNNIRCYVIGNYVYGAEIRSAYIDFRRDRHARLIPAILPDNIHTDCLRVSQALFLEWAAIDWRLSPQGEFIFLQADPSPEFMFFEQTTGFPLTERLVQLLMS
ncbi:MAG: hypothetical protein AAGI45_05205 [Cyanobacteria bacterium P01_H01_bin.26]